MVKVYLDKVVQCLLLTIQAKCDVGDVKGTTLIQQLRSFKETFASIFEENHRWDSTIALLMSSCDIMELIQYPVVCISDSVKMKIGKAKAYLGLALVELLSPDSALDPVVMEKSLSEYGNQLVSHFVTTLTTCYCCRLLVMAFSYRN